MLQVDTDCNLETSRLEKAAPRFLPAVSSVRVPFQESLTFKCSLSSGKLPAWKVENVPLQDSYDIEFECRQKDKCYTQPKTFNNKILINDYEHQVYNNGTKFSFYCPSKNTGKTLDNKHWFKQT